MAEKGKIAAKDHWQTIRSIATKDDSVHDISVAADGLSVTHGIYRTTRLASTSAIKSITHNFHSGQYLILYEGGSLEVFLKDGSPEKVKPRERIEGIIYASKAKIYVAWDNEGSIKLMTQNFETISDVISHDEVNTVMYNEFKNEIVSTSHGKICIWMFRLNNSLLVPKLFLTDNLDPNVAISKVAIEQTSSKFQRLFVAVRNGIVIYRLKDGQCLAQMPDLHKRDISDVLFYQPLQVLLTSANDGSIKVWDSLGNLRSVFVGHTNAVTCLSACQRGPLILSGSTDGSMRLWNIDANEEVECVETGEPLTGMCKKFGESDFYTFTDNAVSFWKINNVYSIFTIIGSKAKILKTTSNPTVPAISYYLCEDACIRFACPKNGNIVSVMMSPNWKRIKDAVSVPAEDKLFALLRDGEILNCSIKTNPCKVEEIWTRDHTGAKSKCTAICLFEHILEEKLVGDRWKDLVTEKTFQNANEKETKPGESPLVRKDRTLLIGGCEDGKLVVYNWRGNKDRGKISFSIEGHRNAIVALANNNAMNQIASCGTDNTVRIWRVFPFAEDALAPLMFILNSEPATHLVYSRHRLCIALQDPSTATYNLTMFKTTDTEPVRIEHSTDDDHQDSITALCCCHKLNIFASASTDGTIKIWDERNSIVRIIKLHSKPSGLCFCTDKGDLLVGIGENVHRIPYGKYLPEKFLRRMVAIRFNEPQGIKSIDVDEEVLANLDLDQKHRLQKARSSELLLAKFIDTIPLEELEERKLEEKEKNLAVSVLKKRDDDLDKILNGELAAKKKPTASYPVREEAWKKYLDLFYKRKPLPAIGKFDDDEDETSYKPIEVKDKFIPERGNTGFFSISTEISEIKKITKNLREKEDDKSLETKSKKKVERSLSFEAVAELPRKEIARPLSVGLQPEFHASSPYTLLRRIMSAPPKIRASVNRNDCLMIVSKAKTLKPIDVPPANDFPHNFETLRNLNKKVAEDAERRQKSFNQSRKEMGMLPVAPDGYLPNSIIVALYKELKKEEKPVEEKTDWKPKGLTQQQLEELEEYNKRKKKKTPVPEIVEHQSNDLETRRSRIFEKFNLLTESPSSEIEIDIDTPPPTPPRSPTPEEAHEESPEPSVKQKESKPFKPIEKLIAKPIVKKTPTPPPRDPTPPPPRPQTPLPRFITQFSGQAWFEKLFPNANPEMFPKPWTVEGFLQLLLDSMKKQLEYEVKTQILAAILILKKQWSFSKETNLVVQSALLTQLNVPVEFLTDDAAGKEHFTKLCLTVLASLDLFDELFIVELMAQYITADINLRQHVGLIFHDIGLEDPHNFFTRELDTFTTYGVFDQLKKKQAIKQQCKSWLDKWMKLFREHIISLSGKIYRAKKGNVVRGTKSSKTDRKGILKKEKKGSIADSPDRKISFMPNEFINDAAESITAIGAINYFCEMEYQQELDRAREASVAPTEDTTKSDRLRNTVVVLPKIDGYRSLARLGETHQSCCHPERETALAYDFRSPHLNPSKQDNFNRGLLLHLNTLTLNPFPNFLDELLYEPYANSQLVTLRSAPKYFVPSRSYVHDFEI